MNPHVLSLPLGPNLVSPIDQASGYSTFANQGTHVETHVIKSVKGPDGGQPYVKTIPVKKPKTNQAFTADVASDATFAMRAVVTKGTGTKAALPDGRPVAGKTGTTSQNKSAWFVGFTPQLSTSVAMWKQTKTKNGGTGLGSLQGIGGYTQIYGGQVPAETFSTFMAKALKDKEVKQFPPPAYGGVDQKWATPKPTATPTPTTPTPNPDDTCRPGERFHHGQPCPQDPQSPPPTSGQPCQSPSGALPLGCDPNTPPSNPPPDWFCTKYSASHGGQIYQGCPDPNNPGGPGKPGKTQTQSLTLARIED
jgi:membrane peptidoglycan carboxypeptidase